MLAVALGARRRNVSIALWAGFVPFALLGAALSWQHTRYYTVFVAGKFRCD